MMKKTFSLFALATMLVLTLGFASACHCGDGMKNQVSEACDDGNLRNNDGCSSTCKIELGWECNTVIGTSRNPDSICHLSCGDGNLDSGEECDLGASNGQTCTPSYGSSCTYCSASCKNVIINGPSCGNGNLDSGEECDDGNSVDGDGCTANCTTETPTVPEFGTVIGMLTALGALGIFFVVRRSK